MKSKKIVIVLIVLGLTIPVWADQDSGSKVKTIEVKGQGAVNAVPDEAEIDLTITEEGESLDEQVSATKAKMTNLINSLKIFQISAGDLQTTQYTIQRKYKYDKGESEPVGYTVTNRLKVILKNIGKIGRVLGAVSGNDIAQINGPTFGFSNPDELHLKALKAALENARAKAEILAETAGATLGSVNSIQETNVDVPGIRLLAMAQVQGADASSSVPVEQGTDQVTAQVEVIYTLK